MATAKTIEQLDAATQINAGDKLPFAQTAGTEAKSGTVAQLAKTVADINETGALTELVYATSQGKNAVAAALTAKGVTTAASETLIQMADKVNNLNVDNSVEQVRGLYMQQNSSTTTQLAVSYPRIFKNIATRDTILLLGTVAYYIPNGSYASWDEFLAGATFTLDIAQEDPSYTFDLRYEAFAVSEDFTKLLVTVNNSNLHQVYNISSSTGFTKLHEFTKELVVSTSNYKGFGVRNDGNYVVYGTDSKELSVYNVTTATDYTVAFPSTNTTFAYLASVLMKDTTLYIFAATQYTSSTYSPLIGKIKYAVDESGIVTFGTIETNQSLPTTYQLSGNAYNWGSWLHIPGQDTVAPLFYTFTSSSYPTGEYVHSPVAAFSNLKVLSFGNISSPAIMNIEAPWLHRSTSATSGVSWYFASCLWHINACVVSYADSVWTIAPCLMPYTIQINTQTSTVAISTGYKYLTSIPYDNDAFYGKALYADPTTKVIIAAEEAISDGEANFSRRYGSYTTSTDPDKILFGYIRTINDQKGYYLPYISVTDLQSGAYDAETTITPAVPDSASNAQADSASGAEEGSAAAGATPQAQAAAADAEGADA